MSSKRYAALLAAVVLLSAAAPAFAASDTDALTVGVSQTDGVIVTVTANGTAVENATVSVEALNNSTYAGAGSDTTDENGTIALPTPANDTRVHIVATKGNRSAETTVTLVASSEENETSADGPFGQQVSSFVSELLSGENVKHPGRTISSWVTTHNPGAEKKADHASNHGHKEDHAKDEGHGTHGNDRSERDNGHGKDKKDHSDNGHGKKKTHNGHRHADD